MEPLIQLPYEYFFEYLKAPGMVSGCNVVLSDEQCGAGSAKPWQDWINQPEAVPGKPAMLQWLSPIQMAP